MENKKNGLLWSVLLIWCDFPLLYYGINSDNHIIITLGLTLLVLGIGYIISFG